MGAPSGAALRVETPGPWRRAVRPAAYGALVAGLFLAGTLAARASGHWRGSVSDRELLGRVRAIDSPAYAHERGRVPPRAEWEAEERRW